jgi:hypothetical protein
MVAQSQPELIDAFVKAMIEINMCSISPKDPSQHFPAQQDSSMFH